LRNFEKKAELIPYESVISIRFSNTDGEENFSNSIFEIILTSSLQAIVLKWQKELRRPMLDEAAKQRLAIPLNQSQRPWTRQGAEFSLKMLFSWCYEDRPCSS